MDIEFKEPTNPDMIIEKNNGKIEKLLSHSDFISKKNN